MDSKTANTTIRRCIVANNSCGGVKVWADGSRIGNTLIYGHGDDNPEPSPWAPIVIDQVGQSGASFEIVNVTVEVGDYHLREGSPASTPPTLAASRLQIWRVTGGISRRISEHAPSDNNQLEYYNG